MSDGLPASRSALRRLASRAKSVSRRQAMERRERKERRWEYAGAFVVLPLAKSLLEQFQLFDLGLDEKLRVAAITGIGSTMMTGAIGDALHGASLGAIGAYTWDAPALLGNLFGKK